MKSVIDEYAEGCPHKQKKQNKLWYRQYVLKNKEKIAKRMREYYQKRKEAGTVYKKISTGKPKNTHRENYYREAYRKRRQECLEAYGGRCQCCGENTYEFLCIDHINNDGKKHREELAKGTSSGTYSGDNIYRWLKRNNYPPGFQVLCHNCNMAKQFYKICPHMKNVF